MKGGKKFFWCDTMIFVRNLPGIPLKILPLKEGWKFTVDLSGLEQPIEGLWELPCGWFGDDEAMLHELHFAATGLTYDERIAGARNYNVITLRKFLNGRYPDLLDRYKAGTLNLGTYWLELYVPNSI